MVVLSISATRARLALTFGLGLAIGLASVRARAAGKTVEGVVNLNTAPAELLSALPGIGPSKALGILAYRARHPFRTVDELVRVKGIGRRMVVAMRAHLAVSGPSTARTILSLGPSAAPAGVVPVAPPVRGPPPACRPVAAPPTTAAIVRAVRAAQKRSIHATANHCRPPA